jgi:hypothetical protein
MSTIRTKTLSVRHQQRTATSVEWESYNQILLSGEFGLESDTLLQKLGDGVTPWNDLPYFNKQEIGDVDGGVYIHNFNAVGSWQGISLFTMTVPRHIHGLGRNVSCDVYHLVDDHFEKYTGYPSNGFTIRIDPVGNVTLMTTVRFAGRLYISIPGGGDGLWNPPEHGVPRADMDEEIQGLLDLVEINTDDIEEILETLEEKAKNTNTVSINGDEQSLGDNPCFTLSSTNLTDGETLVKTSNTLILRGGGAAL